MHVKMLHELVKADGVTPGAQEQQKLVDTLLSWLGFIHDSSMEGFLSIYFRVSQPQPYWHFKLDNSSLGGDENGRVTGADSQSLQMKHPTTSTH